MDAIAHKHVDQALARNLFLNGEALENYDTWIQKLRNVESQTACMFGFDVVGDDDGAANFCRRESKALRFTKICDPIKDLAEVDGSFVYHSFLRGNSLVLEMPVTVSAICGSLPLLTDDGDSFLIATFRGMTDVGALSFGLVSCECCPNALAGSPEHNWGANLRMRLPAASYHGDELLETEVKAVLGIKFDSHANRLTYVYVACEGSVNDLILHRDDNTGLYDLVAEEATVDVVNHTKEPLHWAIHFSGTSLPHLVGLRDATRDEFEDLQQKKRSVE